MEPTRTDRRSAITFLTGCACVDWRLSTRCITPIFCTKHKKRVHFKGARRADRFTCHLTGCVILRSRTVGDQSRLETNRGGAPRCQAPNPHLNSLCVDGFVISFTATRRLPGRVPRYTIPELPLPRHRFSSKLLVAAFNSAYENHWSGSAPASFPEVANRSTSLLLWLCTLLSTVTFFDRDRRFRYQNTNPTSSSNPSTNPTEHDTTIATSCVFFFGFSATGAIGVSASSGGRLT